MNLISCGSCISHIQIPNCNYGQCKLDKQFVYPGNEYCQHLDEIDPYVWYNNFDSICSYISQELKYGINILPKRFDRSRYLKILNKK